MEENKEKLLEETKKESFPMNGNESQNVKKKRKINPKVIITIFLIFAAIAAGFWYWYQGQLGYVSTDDAYIDGDKLSVAAKMLGRITNLYTDEGDKVTKGEVLVRLDSTDLIAQRDQAIMSSKLAKDNLQLAKVNLGKANQDFERAKQQFENKIIPKEQFDHAQSALHASQAQLNIAQTKIGTANAQLNVINTQLQNTIITSPMEGVVAKRWVLTGDVVQPGEPIFTIYNLDSVWVTADLQETDLAPIKEGEKVNISVDTYPDKKFEGKVLQIGTNTASQFSLIPPNNASGNFTKVTQRVPVKISINQVKNNNRSVDLLPGMSVEVKISIGK